MLHFSVCINSTIISNGHLKFLKAVFLSTNGPGLKEMHKFHAKETEIEFLEPAAPHATIFELERILKSNLFSQGKGESAAQRPKIL